MEKIELLPESRYSEEKNGLIKEWLAGDLAKRTEFIVPGTLSASFQARRLRPSGRR